MKNLEERASEDIVDVDFNTLHPQWKKFFQIRNQKLLIFEVKVFGFKKTFERSLKEDQAFLTKIEKYARDPESLKYLAQQLDRLLPNIKHLPPL